MRARRRRANAGKGLDGDARRGVHAEMERDHARALEGLRVEPLDGEIDAAHLEARISQPRRGLGERKGLTAELVGVEEDDLRSH